MLSLEEQLALLFSEEPPQPRKSIFSRFKFPGKAGRSKTE
jgi:hypothetical protein